MDRGLLALRAELDAVGPLAESAVDIEPAQAPYRVLQPREMDALLDGAAADPEQNLPYWAELWPSGIALARMVALDPEVVRGRRTLEIGSGLGVTAAAALRAGADLVAADYSPESLLLCRYNTLRTAGREATTVRLNWRQPDAGFLALAGDGFPVILAADVLYESRDVDPLLVFLNRVLAPAGVLWLAEPGRPPAARFLAAARASGWLQTSATQTGPWPDPKDAGVIVGVHRLVRG